jgi:hypothetical protein
MEFQPRSFSITVVSMIWRRDLAIRSSFQTITTSSPLIKRIVEKHQRSFGFGV